MTKRNFNEDRAACDAATSGNWFVIHDTDIDIEEPEGSGYTKSIANASSVYDARFIAEARTGWPAALDEIAELEVENRMLRDSAAFRATQLRREGDLRMEAELANERLREKVRQLYDLNDSNYARACEYAGEITELNDRIRFMEQAWQKARKDGYECAYAADIAAEIEREVDAALSDKPEKFFRGYQPDFIGGVR